MDLLKLQGMILDEYKLIGILGKGGMSAVYRAYHEELERNVAVKILSDELSQDPGYTERFRREARMSAALEHPNIVPVYDFGTHDGLSFVVMRLLTGGTLGQMMKRGQPMQVNDIVRVVSATASALDYAHNKGIIHRDVKPSNIMFDENGTVYLVDFGIAKAVSSADLALTSEQMVLGTPSYMAPEQWRGDTPTQAVDQYALAIITYQMLTGQPPYEASTPPELMYKHMNETPTPVNQLNTSLSVAVNWVIDRALAKHPDDRYHSVLAFAADLRRALERSGQIGSKEEVSAATLKSPPVKVDSPPNLPVPQSPAAPNAPSSAKETQENRVISTPAPSSEPTQPQIRVSGPPSASPSPTPYSYTPPPDYEQAARGPADGEGMGQRTLMTRVAVGGGIGLILIAIVLVIGAIGLAFALNMLGGNDDNPNTGEVGQVSTQAPQLEPTIADIEGTRIAVETSIASNPLATPTDLPAGDGAAPTNLPGGAGPGVENPPPSVGQSVVLFSEPTEPVRDGRFAPNSDLLASGHGSGAVRLWPDGYGGAPVVLGTHSDVVYRIAWRSDGQMLASASEDGTIKLWDVNSRTLVHNLAPNAGPIRDVTFSPDGTILASAGEDTRIRLWDVATGQEIDSFSGHQARLLAVAISPNGQYIASAGEDDKILVRDLATRNRVSTLRGHSEGVRSLDFSPDGTLLASSSTDNSIRVIAWQTAELRFTLTGQDQDVWVVDFSPDGTLLASGGRDNIMRLYSMANGQQINAYTGHSGWVLGVDFSADGSMLASSGGDGTIRLWRVVQ